MLKKVMLLLTLLTALIPGTAHAQSLRNTIFITEELPPYNYSDNGAIKGISVRVLFAAFDAVGLNPKKVDIRLYPWARGYKTVLETPNTCLFSTVRSNARENDFKWVGPITNASLSFFSRNDGFAINNFEDLKKYVVTTSRQGIGQHVLKENKFSEHKTDYSIDTLTMVKKLKIGRVDLVLENEEVMYHTLKKHNIEWKEFKNNYTVYLGEVYYAFNKETDERVIKKLQEGLNIIRKNGKLSAIVSTIPDTIP